jgi:glycosyltransferase involved in cell wall biosynthesis
MVAAEGAASGAFPICANHSGLAEVTGILGESLPPAVRELLTFERGMRSVEDLGFAMTEWLQLDDRLRSSARAALVRTSEEHFGWESVAETVLAASRGRTTRLDPVPGTVPFAPTGT